MMELDRAFLQEKLGLAIREVMATLLKLSPVNTSKIADGGDAVPEPSFVTTIGLTGPFGAASIALLISHGDAQKMVARMLNEESAEESDLTDGLGEFLNVVAGCFKRELGAATGVELALSLPSVVLGSDLRVISQLQDTEAFFLLIEAEGVRFVGLFSYALDQVNQSMEGEPNEGSSGGATEHSRAEDAKNMLSSLIAAKERIRKRKESEAP
jgi:CheY-specific phosphatase CheX